MLMISNPGERRANDSVAIMKIRVGYELIYDCPQPTPMVLMLNIHHTRAGDIVVPDRMIAEPFVPMTSYRDGFGNWCTRILAPAGRLRLSANALLQRHRRARPDRPCRSTSMRWKIFPRSRSSSCSEADTARRIG